MAIGNKYVGANLVVRMLLVFSSSLSLFGCSIIMPKDDPGDYGSNFEVLAAATNNTKSVPAEVALGIEKAQENKKDVAPSANKSDGRSRVVNRLQQHVLSPKNIAVNAKPLRARRPANHNQNREGGTEDYTVKSGDTLMKIAFKKYGNIYRWREIYETNKGKISDLNRLPTGTVLTVNGAEYVVIHRNGKPYLIRRNDTLMRISAKLYGTPRFWALLWHNNPELIIDPNKIYAGFTIYYPEDPNASLAEQDNHRIDKNERSVPTQAASQAFKREEPLFHPSNANQEQGQSRGDRKPSSNGIDLNSGAKK